jgi:3-isopropylmalate/(R)-2-methylmalate dehydratase small subunit
LKAFKNVSGTAIPLLENDINTDQIAPVGGGARMSEDYAETLFKHRRRRPDGTVDPDFVLNRPQFRNGPILVSGRNFGCGSSRESAVWALQAIGIECIIARSFADIYRENCLLNGVLPVMLPEAEALRLEQAVLAADGVKPFTVDLVSKRIAGPDGFSLGFEIADSDRIRLLEGLDDIGLTLKHLAEIETFECRMAELLPWSQRADVSHL